MNITDFNKCSNCGACYNICPHGAIYVREEALFYTPTVDETKCVDCELCVKVCPVNNEIEILNPIDAFAGWHKDENVVLSSSSGGFLYGIAQNILECDGVVYGAVYSDNNREVVFNSTDTVELCKIQKSKYVESKVSDTFIHIKRDLEKKRNVLFCGTPCQVAGLKNFLGKEYDELITCDFVCGGLPSHKLYEEYLDYLEDKYNSKIKSVDFRPKTHGWKRYAVLIKFENGKRYNALGVEDPFLRSFLYGKLSVRDYCLKCKFSDTHQSDITIADFWRHEKLSDLKNENGISLAICNTEKGYELFSKLKKDYLLERLELESALYNHKKIQSSKAQIEVHDKFLQNTQIHGFLNSYKMSFKDSWKVKLKNHVVRSIFKR